MSLNVTIQQLESLIEQLKKYDSLDQEGTTEGIYRNFSEGVYQLKATSGYCENVDVLCNLKDTCNGFIAHFPSYSNAVQENYICMDYAEADYLRKLLNYIHSKRIQ